MYKELLRSITGIEIFPVISLCLFVLVFSIAVTRAWRLDARRALRLSYLPLEDQPAEATNKDVTL